jgi:outer membrane receptor protein involved in Fe transport
MRFCLTFAAVMACSGPAWSQDIVVTADRETLLRSGPGSYAGLDAEDLPPLDAQTPSEVLNRLPGVAIQRNNGVENLLAIRSPVLTGGQSAGSFLVLDHGVPVRAPGFSNVNQIWETSFDFADSVSVLRGPGSSVYGSNAVHGVLNVATRSGVLDSSACVAHAGSVGIDGLGRRDAQIIVRGGVRRSHHTSCPPPSSQGEENFLSWDRRWRGVAGFNASSDEGWRDASGLDRQALLLGFGWGSPHGLWEVEGRLIAQNLNQESAGFIEGPDAFRSRALASGNPAPEAYRDTRLVRAQATFTRRGGGQQWRITPFARAIEADLNLFFFPSRAQEITRQGGGGVQASASWELSPALGLVAGLDVDQSRGEVIEFQSRPTVGTFTQGLHYDYAVDMSAVGVYAEANWAVAPRWSLTAGVRGERVRYAYDNRTDSGDVGRFRRPADRSDTFEGLTPRLALMYRDGGMRWWLSYARGARPPQITDLYSLQTRQNPGEQGLERLDSLEVGWRRAWDAAAVEFAAFAMDKRDTSFRGADGFTVSGGATRHLGIEVSGSVRLSDHWAGEGWASYAEHSYRFDSQADGIRSGALIDTAPLWLGYARLSYRADTGGGVDLEWTHVGESFTNAANSETYPGHDVFNLRAVAALSPRVEAFAAVRNLTNTAYADRADFAFGAERYFPGAPRSVTIGLRYRGG